MSTVDINFAAIAPIVTLAVAALVVLVLDLILPYERSRPWWYAVSLGGIALSFWYLVGLWSNPAGIEGRSAFGGAYLLDRFGLIFGAIALGAAFLCVLQSVYRKEKDVSGYLALVLWSAMGMMVLAGAGNFLTIFMGLEVLSLSLYVVVAFGEGDAKSKEAAFKYLVLGSVASATILYGFAFVYGQTGSMDLGSVLSGWSGSSSLLMKVGVGLVLLAFGFKLALAPFHVWAPDVYQGASAPITAFMSVGTRAAAFAALTRFLMAALPEQGSDLLIPLWVLAALSMVVGSLGACVQANVKRLLAYSSIAHAGYLAIAWLGFSNLGISAGVFYIAAYLFMNTGAFAIVVWLSKGQREGDTLEDFAGLFYRRPWLAAAMTLFMLSLAGFPTTAGFAGKIFLVSSAMASGMGSVGTWLVGLLAATSAISAYAYVRVIVAMFKGERASGALEASLTEREAAAASEEVEESKSGSLPALEDATGIGASWALSLVVVVSIAGTLYLGLAPQSVLALASQLLPLQ